MANIKELKEQRNELKEKMVSLLSSVTETRSLNSEDSEEVRKLEKQIDDLTSQIEKLEKENRSNTVEKKIEKGEDNKMTREELEIRMIEKFIKTGEISDEIRATQTSAANVAIQPTYIDNELVRRLEEVAPVFSKARQYQSRAGELKIPREAEANLYQCGFVGEDAEVPEKAFSFDTISLKSVRVGAYVKVTQQLLNDVELDIVSYVVDMLARRLGATLDHHAIVGTGTATSHDDLQGLATLTNATDKVNEVSATALTSDVLLDAIHALHPSLLNGAEFYMNRKTYNAISKIKDSDGQYILKLEKSVAVEQPHYTVFGFRVNVTDDVPDNKVLFVNVGQACATMVKKGSQMVRISNDTQNALKGTHTFVIDAYVDFRLRDPQAVAVINVTE